MFTGIIEEVGAIEQTLPLGEGRRLRVHAEKLVHELHVNDSVALNGACHTVVRKGTTWFDVDSVEETLKKTTMGLLKAGDPINLELPVRLNARLGGHLVLGHVDTVGDISSIDRRSTSWLYGIRFNREFIKYVIPVGSVAIDGVSLTVAETDENILRLSIIPHTMSNTIFPGYTVGSKVNIEFDVVGKYIERMVTAGAATLRVQFPSETDLRQSGY